ncbi:right-handed parallel beta-helix repeat-containing protein, partial [Candidatus Gottesmanbacteria bacterium]|nr:right-handed parallel beta-helix repeat-containing protein [Candidatus Gottesmanbacteria bacterium]
AAIPFVDTPAGRTSLAQRFFEGRGTNIRFVPDGFLAPRLTFRAATPGQAFSVTEQAPRSIADRAREALDQWRSARPAPAAQSVPVPVPARSAPAAIPAPAARAGGFQIPRLAPASALVLLLPLPFIGGSLPSITLPNTSDVKSFVESLIFRYRQKPSVPVSLFGVAPISRSGVVPVPKVTPLPVYQFPTVPGLVAKPAAPPVGPAVIAGVTSFCTRSGCRVTNDPKNAPIRVCTFSGSCEGNYSSFCGPSWQEIVSGKNHATCIDLAPGKTYETPAVKISCGSWQTDIAVNEKPLAADHGIDLTSCGGGKASTNSLKSIKELGVTTLSPGTVILSNAIALTIPKGAVTKITDTTVTITLPDGTVITLPSDNVYIGFGDAPADASLYNRGVTPSPTPTKTPTPTPTTKKPDGASVYTATCMTPAQLDAIGGEITSSVHLCGGTYRPITVKSSNIFVDCAGNCQIDAGTGTGVSVQGLDNVSITNLAIKTTTPPDQREGSLGRFGIDSWCGTFKGVGVSLVDSSGSSVSNVRIVSAGDKAGVVGIDICGGSGNEVANSDFSNNSGWGVRVVASDGNKILHNTANGNIRSGANESACALLVGNRTVGKGADGNILYGNNLNGCGDGVYINGYDFPTSNGNVIANNYIDSAQANCIEATGNATAGTSGTNIIVNNTVGQRCGNYQGWITYTKNTFYCGNGKGTVVTKESSGTIVDDSAVCPDSALANAEKQGIALGHLSEALVVSQPKGPATNNDASIRVNRIDLPFAESALQRDADVRRDLANQSCNPSKDEPKVVPSELGIVVCTDAGRSVGDGRFVGQCQPTQKSYDPANDTFLWCGDNARWVPYEDPAERANLVAAIKQEHDLEAKYDLNVYNRVGYWHDLNVVDSALSRFSKSDIKGITLEGIIRPSTEFNGSYILGSGGYADPSQKNRASYILTNKSVTAEGQQRIESVITHEIIHVIDQNKGYLSDSQDFKSAIAAEKITFSSDGIYKGGQLLSKDYNCSKPNPVELFACVGSVFKISPEKLQKDIPQMYTYFQGTKI